MHYSRGDKRTQWCGFPLNGIDEEYFVEEREVPHYRKSEEREKDKEGERGRRRRERERESDREREREKCRERKRENCYVR